VLVQVDAGFSGFVKVFVVAGHPDQRVVVIVEVAIVNRPSNTGIVTVLT